MIIRYCLLGGAALLMGAVVTAPAQEISQQAYLKASNTGAGDEFGAAVSISGDTLVIGAPAEDSAGSTQSDNSASAAGAVYVFTRSGDAWTQQACLKASNAEAGDRFGQSVALSGDTLVVGANGEDSDGVLPTDNSAAGAGAAYVFTRVAGVWTQQAYLKALNAGAGDAFGAAVSLSGDTAVIGAPSEDSSGDPANNSLSNAGAAYVFVRSGSTWSQQAYLKAGAPGAGDQFGFSLSIFENNLVVGANQEDSHASGVNGDEGSDSAPNSGAAYVFVRESDVWHRQAYLKASNTGASDQFGFSVSLWGDLLAVAAPQEASSATGVNGSQSNNASAGAGAVYLFRRGAGSWSQEAYLKASNTGGADGFGQSVSLRDDTVVVGAMGEDSNATGVNGSQTNNISSNSGAAYVFARMDESWAQQSYVKASNTGSSDQFGRAVAISGRTAVIGANLEASSATGPNGNSADNSASGAGAAYVFSRVGTLMPEPELDVEQPPGNLLADDGSVVDFGLVGVGAPAVTRTFTLLNRGTADLLITNVTAGGDFTVDRSGLSSLVAPGGLTSFSVSFSPGHAGRLSATLTIDSNDSDEAPYQIILTGAALPEVVVSGNGVNILDGDTLPSSLDHTDFGILEVAGGARSRSFRIDNTGVAALTLSSVVISGEHAPDFAVTSSPAPIVAPGSFTTFEITFDPSVIGLRTAEISFVTNDDNESSFDFRIQGLGAGPGLTDASFGRDGRAGTGLPGADERARGLALQPDGRMVVAGYAHNGLATDFAVVRYLPDGSLDPEFGAGGMVTTSVGESYDEATGVALQPDGRIVVCGFSYNGANDDAVLVRYLPSGQLDPAFGQRGVATVAFGRSDDRAYGVVVQPDGKIIIVGSAYNGNSADVALARYHRDGTLDVGFGRGGKVVTSTGPGDDLGYAAALQRDGRLVVTGKVQHAVRHELLLLRYTSTGALDPSFGQSGKAVLPQQLSDSAGYSVSVRRGGHIVVGGYTTNPTDTDWLLARFMGDGRLDPSFGADGVVISAVGSSYEEIASVVTQADGSVLAAGFARRGGTDEFALMRFLPDGRVDMGFGTDGKVTTHVGQLGGYAASMAVQPDGKILVAGYGNNGTDDDMVLVRYAANPVVLPPDIVAEDAAHVEILGGGRIDFGGVLVGQSSSRHVVRLYNEGTLPLNISSVSKAGASTDDYTVDVSGMSASLGAGDSTSFAITFSPLALGIRTISLEVSSNDVDDPVLTMLVSGEGLLIAPEINVVGNSTFGEVLTGQSQTRTFTIYNEGSAALQLPSGVTIEGGGGAFSVGRQPAQTSVMPGAFVEFDVTFAPSTSGPQQAGIVIANNDGNENPVRFPLEGVGLGSPEISIETAEGSALLSNMGAVDFGSVTLGSGLASRAFIIQNLGTENLLVSQLFLDGGISGDFELNGAGSNSVIPPGGSMTVTVNFYTATLGLRSSRLHVISNDADESPFIINLSGHGVAAEPSIVVSGMERVIADDDITPSDLDGTDFGITTLGGAVTRTFKITNQGSADLHLTETVPNYVHVNGSGFSVTRQPSMSTITPGRSVTFEVTFEPDSFTPGVYDGVISIGSDDADQSPFQFALRGTALGVPELDVEQPAGVVLADEASVVDFGLTPVGGAPALRTFMLVNRGTADLTISQVSAGGDFTVISQSMVSVLPPGGTVQITVSFSPTREGQASATLSILSDDRDESPYEITLTGAALPEIVVTGNGTNINDGDTLPSGLDHTEFGTVELQSGSRKRTFVIANTGTASLTLGPVSVSGDFMITALPASVVAPGSSTTLEITFDPTRLGLRSGEVSLTNNDRNENPFSFWVQGTGTGPGLTDPNFDGDGRVQTGRPGQNERARALALQADGKTVVAGYAENGTDTDVAVVRYLADGRLDNSFGQAGMVVTPVGLSFDEATGITLQDDGRIVVCGFAHNETDDDVVLIRYLSDGQLDPTFGEGGKVMTALGNSDDRAYGVAVQADGRIVIVGSAYSGTDTDVALVRYLPDGRLDAAFGQGGTVITRVSPGEDLGYAMCLLRDGRIAITGKGSSGSRDDVIVLRYQASGELDPTFGQGGKVITANGISSSAGLSIAIRRNGELIVGGYASNPTDTDWLVARYSLDGSLDPSFGSGGRVITRVGSSDEEVNCVVVQPDGGILAAGFTRNNNTDDIAVIRMLGTGALDESFGDGGKVVTSIGSSGDYAFAMGVQPDGRIAVAGYTQNGVDDDIAVVRYVASAVTLPATLVLESPIYAPLASLGIADLGRVFAGESGTPRVFTLTNDGTEALVLGSLVKTGLGEADFVLDVSETNTTVPAGRSTHFTVRFAPQASGRRAATISLASNDAASPFLLRLSGDATNTFSGTQAVSGPGAVVATVTGRDYRATDRNFAPVLAYAPAPGESFTAIEVTTPQNQIFGQFNDLPQGGVVALAYDGVIYHFQADYRGGNGNDLVLTHYTPSAEAEWKWVAGPKSRNGAGIYGSRGVAASGSNPGGRQGAMNWRAPDGSLWLMGGYGYATAVTNPPRYLNDLWQFDRTIGRWIWRAGSNTPNQFGIYGTQGLEAAQNAPGSRHTGTTWTDENGNLWLFGGFGVGTGMGAAPLNDLWRYNRTTGRWTWMKGSTVTNAPSTYGVQGVAAPANTPGARSSATGVFSRGYLWLFGGYNGTQHFNDLWCYEIATGEWTWVSGSREPNKNSVYGELGVSAGSNQPGSRRDATGWEATDGTLWFFGGLGLEATGSARGDLNDLWRYNPANREWTWMKGGRSQGAGDSPAARSAGSGWVTADGDLWLVGGFKDSALTFNDVWIFDTGSHEWTWKQGSRSTLSVAGVYGTQGVAGSDNLPGGRFTPSTWVTLNGSLWIFGGGGADAFGNNGRLSDLWTYGVPDPAGTPYGDTMPDAFPRNLIINAAPSASSTAASTTSYVPVSGQLGGSDADGDRLAFRLVGGASSSQGQLHLMPEGAWSFMPAYAFTGMVSFQFKAADPYGGESAVSNLLIHVMPHRADTDSDGMLDDYERQLWGDLSISGNEDSDADGQTNLAEFMAQTDPLDGADMLVTSLDVRGSSLHMTLSQTRPGVIYRVEKSEDLKTWQQLQSFTFGVSRNARMSVDDAEPGTPSFYRVVLEATSELIQP